MSEAKAGAVGSKSAFAIAIMLCIGELTELLESLVFLAYLPPSSTVGFRLCLSAKYFGHSGSLLLSSSIFDLS